MESLQIKANLMSGLCFLVSLMEKAQDKRSPLHSCQLEKIFSLAMALVHSQARHTFFDITHIGKFRKRPEKTWRRAQVTLCIVLAVIHEEPVFYEEMFGQYVGGYYSKLDEKMHRLKITNSRMAHLCFLAELAQKAEFYSRCGVSCDQIVEVMRACVFLKLGTIDAVYISKFRNGHQLPWGKARAILSRTMGIILGEPITESDLFPEYDYYRRHGQYWPLRMKDYPIYPKANRIVPKVSTKSKAYYLKEHCQHHSPKRSQNTQVQLTLF